MSYDTPVDDDDQQDVKLVLEGIDRSLPYLPDRAMVLISSQIPAGTCRLLEGRHPDRWFACCCRTEWPQLLDIDWQKYLGRMNHRIVVDANGFLRSKLSALLGVIHRSAGIPRIL